jgi:hypothetical protein
MFLTPPSWNQIGPRTKPKSRDPGAVQSSIASSWLVILNRQGMQLSQTRLAVFLLISLYPTCKRIASIGFLFFTNGCINDVSCLMIWRRAIGFWISHEYPYCYSRTLQSHEIGKILQNVKRAFCLLRFVVDHRRWAPRRRWYCVGFVQFMFFFLSIVNVTYRESGKADDRRYWVLRSLYCTSSITRCSIINRRNRFCDEFSYYEYPLSHAFIR